MLNRTSPFMFLPRGVLDSIWGSQVTAQTVSQQHHVLQANRLPPLFNRCNKFLLCLFSIRGKGGPGAPAKAEEVKGIHRPWATQRFEVPDPQANPASKAVDHHKRSLWGLGDQIKTGKREQRVLWCKQHSRTRSNLKNKDGPIPCSVGLGTDLLVTVRVHIRSWFGRVTNRAHRSFWIPVVTNRRNEERKRLEINSHASTCVSWQERVGFNKKLRVKASSQERILDSVVFNRDMDVGRQEGHQLQIELDL